MDHTAPALTNGRALLSAPVAPATWAAVSQATIGFPFLLAAGIPLIVLAPLGLALVPVLGVGVPVLLVALVAARGFAGVERARLRSVLGIAIERGSAPRPRSLRSWAGLWSALTEPAAWSAVLYAALGLALVSVEVTVAWGLGLVLALIASPLVAWDGGLSPWQVGLFVLGLVGPWLWAAACQGLALVHVRLARALLVRSTTDVERAEAAASAAREDADRAQQRAEHLDQTRTRAVGAADDDRRRIERDLHDGAQQRLVALGVELGTARRAAASDPAVATAALDHAHQEIKETLTELRDLVRGIHPAVLTDRGLDAALSAIAARHPVPVTVDVPDAAALAAASPGAQAAAYFVTAEALTNSARHAAAARVLVRAEVDGDVLRLEVADDGRGGALAAPGGGLDGLRSRVEALDGTFLLDSPEDRGTRITVEVPCAS
ncbi:sensor domain-containing protein [Sanguibacter sp. 25GB23B1]|uniref:sensor histidine kinase n=1 Tax=unclassified Sanguibacter TaxID=2645534 RepID=UPI0032AF07C2